MLRIVENLAYFIGKLLHERTNGDANRGLHVGFVVRSDVVNPVPNLEQI